MNLMYELNYVSVNSIRALNFNMYKILLNNFYLQLRTMKGKQQAI